MGYAVFDSTPAIRQIRLYDHNDNLLASSDLLSLPAADGLEHHAIVSHVGGVLTARMDGVCVEAECPDSGDPFVYLGSDGGTVHFTSFNFAKGKDTSEPKDGGCEIPESCPPPPCDDCSPDPPGALLADLSAFALTERTCTDPTGPGPPDSYPNHCADLANEFVLIPVPTTTGACAIEDSGCCRAYVDAQFSQHCCNSLVIYVCSKLQACIVDGADPTKRRWRFTVFFAISCSGGGGDPSTFLCYEEDGTLIDPSGLGGATSAVYYSEDFDADACAVGPWTMTKDSELLSCPCGGTFPDTFPMEAA